ncbi:SoxR reducing system RseC family protein [Ferrimonas lipolytica]|uniref:SoxR reducing system RseC family protein n=1 Tax=Ferrimonas lipolytica TaxID=2724191 RepID=A0A6H1UEI8_9GAMM|nr:SoxR reducing system RseC family protein [Ferrimonas lipolytica]QIZ76626.1 SoxR reducing system RseC family protein [Ferrimonas lipolytica]
MALIHCAACSKKISNRAGVCPHCGFSISDDPEKQEQAARIRAIHMQQQLMNHSFVALLLFVGGFAIWWWGGEPSDGWRKTVGIGSMALGFGMYLITRIRIVLNKRGR